MNKLSKVGRALIILGSLIFAWMVILVFLHFAIHLSIPVYIQLAVTATMVTAFVLGIILMFLRALYDWYKTIKTEEAHENTTNFLFFFQNFVLVTSSRFKFPLSKCQLIFYPSINSFSNRQPYTLFIANNV